MKYEFKKIIKCKVIWIIYVITIVLSLYNSLTNTHNDIEGAKEQKIIYDKYMHLPQGDDIKAMLEADYSEYLNDKATKPLTNGIDINESVYLELINKVNYFDDVKEYRNNVVNASEYLMKYSDNYISRLNAKLYHQYNKDLSFYLFEDKYLQRAILLQTSYLSVIMLLGICTIAIYAFYIDRKNNITILMYTSKNGRTKTYINKLKTIFALIIILQIITSIISLIPQFVLGDLNDFFQPIQSSEQFMYSPYNMNYLELLLIVVLMNITACLIISTIAIISIIAIKNVIVPLIISLIISASLFMSYMLVVSHTSISYGAQLTALHSDFWLFNLCKKYSIIFYLFNSSVYFEFSEQVNILNFPISRLVMTMGLNFIILVIMIIVGLKLYTKKPRRI